MNKFLGRESTGTGEMIQAVYTIFTAIVSHSAKETALSLDSLIK